MAARHSVSGHPLLSAAAAALEGSNAGKFSDLNELAEGLLGLEDEDFAELRDQQLAKQAVALQVNRLVAADSDGSLVASGAVSSETEGRQSRSYKVADNAVIGLDSTAQFLAARLLEKQDWGALESVRTVR